MVSVGNSPFAGGVADRPAALHHGSASETNAATLPSNAVPVVMGLGRRTGPASVIGLTAIPQVVDYLTAVPPGSPVSATVLSGSRWAGW
jgi:hypothetical protein